MLCRAIPLFAVVEGGTKDVPVGADIGTLVHTEEDIAFYQQAQISQGTTRPSLQLNAIKLVGSKNTRWVRARPAVYRDD